MKSIRSHVTWLVPALACLAAGQGSAALPDAEKPSVILVTVDTLRADRLAPYGYDRAGTPQVASLAREGVVFENAYVQTPITLPSHASILTGTYPMYHKLQDVIGSLRDGVPTLATVLKQSGYSTGAFVGSTVLSSRWKLNRGFDVYDDRFEVQDGLREVDFDRIERRADDVLTPALNWLESSAGRPFFLWIHFYDPHDPYTPPEPFATEFRGRPYDGEIGYVDAVFGKLVQRLRARSLFDKSLIVFTSDHGESLGEHQELHHGYFLYESSLRVPLIIKFPDARYRGTRLPNRVRSVDIAPTILQVLNVRPPVSIQGESLVGFAAGKRGRLDLPVYAETYYPKIHFNWSPLFAYLAGANKYIEAPQRELYDLERDPREASNIVEANTAVAGKLKTELQAIQKRFTGSGGSGPEAARSVDPDTVARLKSLGYVAFSASSGNRSDDRDLPDPKQKISVYNQLNRGIALSRGRMPDRAIQVFTQVAAAEAGMPIVHFLLGMEYFEKRWFLKAIEEFKETLKLNPDSTVAMFNLARSYLESGQTEQAESGFKYLIALEPDHFAAHHFLSIAYSRRANYRLAADEESKALSIRPDYDEGHNNLGSYYLNLDETDKAIEAYRKALALNAGFVIARTNLALAYLRKRSFDDAIREAREVLARDPRQGLAHFYLGQAYSAKGMKPEAREAFQKAKELDPKLNVPSGF